MRAIVLACVCATGCELYFGPGDRDAAPSPPPDAVVVSPPDAAMITPPDPPATCSTTAVYVAFEPGDPRGPFVAASIKDALAFYHVPITTTAPAGAALTIQLSPKQPDSISTFPTCLEHTDTPAIVADDRSRDNDAIVASALRGLGVLDGLPMVVEAGDCLKGDGATPGCTFGRAQTIAAGAAVTQVAGGGVTN